MTYKYLHVITWTTYTLTEVIIACELKWRAARHVYEAVFMHILVRKDVTTFASLV